MCGIIFGRRSDNKPVFKNLFKRYLQQSHRGDEGFGYIAIKNGKVKGVKRFQDQNEVQEALKHEDSSEILFHHRYPTSTPNFADLNHPITVKNKKLKHNYYVVHNGVLSNEETLRTKHEQDDYKYTTVYQEFEVQRTANMNKEKLIEEKFNDSESLAIELALYFDGHKTTIDAIGTIAFICIQTDKKDNIENIFYGRNTGNPLVVETVGNDMVFIKSEGQGEKIDSDIIYCEDYKTHELIEIDVKVGKLYQVYTGYGQGTLPDSNRTGYNVLNGYAPMTARTPYDYDDDDGFPTPHIDTKYGHYKVGVTDEYDEDEEYASFRIEEIDAELTALYEQQEDCKATIDEWKDIILAGRNFDSSHYDVAMIEKEKEETNLDSINRQIKNLTDELQDIVETTGLESSVIDFTLESTEADLLLEEYKDVK